MGESGFREGDLVRNIFTGEVGRVTEVFDSWPETNPICCQVGDGPFNPVNENALARVVEEDG